MPCRIFLIFNNNSWLESSLTLNVCEAKLAVHELGAEVEWAKNYFAEVVRVMDARGGGQFVGLVVNYNKVALTNGKLAG